MARKAVMTPEVTVLPIGASPAGPACTQCHSDDVSEAENVGFGALLDRVCTTRLHGDITDKNFAPNKLPRKVKNKKQMFTLDVVDQWVERRPRDPMNSMDQRR